MTHSDTQESFYGNIKAKDKSWGFMISHPLHRKVIMLILLGQYFNIIMIMLM